MPPGDLGSADRARGQRVDSDAIDHFDAAAHGRLERSAELTEVGHEHKTRREQRDHVLQRTEVVRYERIRRRDWGKRDADVLGRQCEQQVLQVVAGEYCERSIS